MRIAIASLSAGSWLALDACSEGHSSGPPLTQGEPGSADAGSAETGAPNAGHSARTGSSAGANEADPCSREALRARVDAYYTALAAHDPSRLPLASGVKYTENGEEVPIGDGLWQTAGALTFKRSAVDPELCTSVSESVIEEGDAKIVLGLRLRTEHGELTEIESIVVRSTERYQNPDALAETASDDWESVLADDQQPARDTLSTVVELYFSKFPSGACNFAATCARLENGFSPPGTCTDFGIGCDPDSVDSPTMRVRLTVVDVAASIGVGFTLWRNASTDFHMFKVRDGEVQAVHAVLAVASSSGWD